MRGETTLRTCTFTNNGIVRVLSSSVLLCEAFDPNSMDESEYPEHKEYIAVWDTGASITCISNTVIKDLSLKPIGPATSYGSGGARESTKHLVNVVLPNRVGFSGINVLQADLVIEEESPRFDVLIGMDLLSRGDFAVTNHNGKTTFSFRMPSMDRIDFTKYPIPRYENQPTKNSLCPCGSGYKYKLCHGRK